MAGRLLEREGELAVLGGALERARLGDGSLVLIEGEAGIGKTALLEEAGARGRAIGLRVVTARGDELELDFPFGVVRQLLEPVLRQLGESERRAVMSGAAGLAAPVVDGANTQAALGGDGSFAAVHGLYWLTANLCDRTPLLICVDDLQWVDGPSLRFLAFVARRLSGLAAAMVVCNRSGEPTADPARLAKLADGPHARLVRPAALSERGAATLIADGLGKTPEERFAAACWAATGGVPFLLRELVRSLAVDRVNPVDTEAQAVDEQGPATVAHATLMRIARLPQGAESVARAVAVLGPAAEPQRVAALTGLDLSRVVQAADGLAEMNLLVPGRPLRFTHAIVRAAVYDDLGEGGRALAHARAAELLSAEDADLDAIAAHLLLSAPARRSEVVEQLRLAAAKALARGAPENAAAYVRRALDEGVDRELRAALLFELAGAEATTGAPEAVAHLEHVMELTADPVLRARAGFALSYIVVLQGGWERSIAAAEEALSALDGRDHELAVALEGMISALASLDPSYVHKFDDRRESLRAALEDGVATARRAAFMFAAVATQRAENLDEVAPLVERGLDNGRLPTDQHDRAWAGMGINALVYNDEFTTPARLLTDLLAVARDTGSVSTYVLAMASQALLHSRQGDLISVQDDVLVGFECCQEHGLALALPLLLAYGLEALLERDELAHLAALALAIELPPDLAATFFGAMLLDLRGRLRHRNHDARAIEDLRSAGSTLHALGFRNPNASDWRSALALALPAADVDEAHQLVRDELADARRIGLPRAIGLSLRTLGVLEGGASGLDSLRESVALLERSPARLEHARSLVELGAAMRRSNKRVEARAPLSDGLDLARRCGATCLAERARAELLATGARPRRDLRSGLQSLTPSELRVAHMAADGLSNPQIAQSLFVTRNTIETHLRHIFSKLDISSRDELPHALDSEKA